MSWQISIIIFADVGLINAAVISYHQQKQKRLICPFKSRCDRVLSSKWSSLFYFRNETVGIMYYLAVILLVLVPHILPQFSAPIFLLLLASGIISALFSIFLLFLQAFVIHEWCFWCLIAALVNMAIFTLEVYLFWF